MASLPALMQVSSIKLNVIIEKNICADVMRIIELLMPNDTSQSADKLRLILLRSSSVVPLNSCIDHPISSVIVVLGLMMLNWFHCARMWAGK